MVTNCDWNLSNLIPSHCQHFTGNLISPGAGEYRESVIFRCCCQDYPGLIRGISFELCVPYSDGELEQRQGKEEREKVVLERTTN